MIYYFVRWIARLTLQSYFRRMAYLGSERIPAKGPVIFVSNHPSAFMDPMVVATSIRRPIHFLAAAEFFGSGVKAGICVNYLKMIPVYRPTTLPNETHRNEAIFSKCFELLARGGALLVFPEGNSVTEKRLRKLKTGVARMALGTRPFLRDGSEVQIVPVGLNYNNPHRFRSELLINIGNPISTRHYPADQAGIIRLTEDVEKGLKETVLHVQNEGLDTIIKKVDLILKSNLPNKGDASRREEEFTFQQNLIESIQKYYEHNPMDVKNIESRVNDYLNRLKDLSISDKSIATVSILFKTWEFLRLVLALPLFLTGFVANAIPYYATTFYFKTLNLFDSKSEESTRKKVGPAFKGSIAMAIGMVFFIIWYLVLAGASVVITARLWAGVLIMIVAYFSGLFTMRYIRWWFLLMQKLKFRKLLLRQSDLFTSLIVERKQIIEELEKMIK